MNTLTILRHLAGKLRSSETNAIHDYRNVFLRTLNLISSVPGIDSSRSTVLVVGCGYNYPDPLLWSTVAEYAVGIDLRMAFWRSGYTPLVRELRRRGASAIGARARAMLTRRTYSNYHESLRAASGRAFDEMSQDLATYDGRRLPFADESFDITLSNAVLEHVSDLEALSHEMARVTRHGGICFHLWHNYYALSGAHVPEEMTLANPWGHLLGDKKVQNWLQLSGTYLNKLLPSEIGQVLSNDFNLIAVHKVDRNHYVEGMDNEFEYEGEAYLTPELQARIGRYPKDVLMTRAYAFLGFRSR